jgi:hypothetical protein
VRARTATRPYTVLPKRTPTSHLAYTFSILLLGSPGLAHAVPFQIVGPRALGMGGTQVKVADDTAAVYWTPVAYGLYHSRTVLGHQPLPPGIADDRHHSSGPPRPDRLPQAMAMGVGGGIVGREHEDILTAVNWFLAPSQVWRSISTAPRFARSWYRTTSFSATRGSRPTSRSMWRWVTRFSPHSSPVVMPRCGTRRG